MSEMISAHSALNSDSSLSSSADRIVFGLSVIASPCGVRGVGACAASAGRGRHGCRAPRKWPADAKAETAAESLAEGAVVSEVARHHGLSPQQLFGWRACLRDAVKGSAPSSNTTPAFVPAIVENEAPSPAAPTLPVGGADPAPAVLRSRPGAGGRQSRLLPGLGKAPEDSATATPCWGLCSKRPSASAAHVRLTVDDDNPTSRHIIEVHGAVWVADFPRSSGGLCRLFEIEL